MCYAVVLTITLTFITAISAIHEIIAFPSRGYTRIARWKKTSPNFTPEIEANMVNGTA